MNNTMSAETLLVEIRTEELPPNMSERLAMHFVHLLSEELQQAEFTKDDKNKRLFTPRRLAALLQNIHAESPARQVSRRGPQVEACRDASGSPTKALVGFMHAVGVTCESDLTEIAEKGKRYVAWEGQVAGRKLADDLASMVEKVLLSLSAPRLMRWGDNNFRFVRPVRGVLMMHGENVIGGTVMNVAAGKTTKGHPILTTDEIVIASADDYEKTICEKGMIVIDGEMRRQEIAVQLWQAAKEKKCCISLPCPPAEDEKTWYDHMVLRDGDNLDNELLWEVAAMCERPAVYAGKICDTESLPDFCVVGCMKKHQRFFPSYDKNCVLNREHYFVVVDNKPTDPSLMLAGFDSVLHARLRDLSFYYAEDTKHSKDKKHLANYYLERLKTVTYHGKLGSQYDRVCRLQKIAHGVAELMNLDDKQKALLEESVKLCKADLTTLIVGEYPDMEGKIAAEYFCTDEVAEIVRYHNVLATKIDKAFCRAYYALLLANNLEKLVGMFGIGEKPTGSKDPHGLRTAAFRIVCVLRDAEKNLAGDKLLHMTMTAFDELPHFDLHEVWDFIIARMPLVPSVRQYMEIIIRHMQIGNELQKAVLAKDNFFPADIYSRVQAVRDFAKLPESEIFIATNKRINNIFRKSGVESDSFSVPDVGLFEEEAEHALHRAVDELAEKTVAQVEKSDYESALKTLALAATPINDFFEKVLVNAKDEKVRRNRFALLHELRTLLNCVADISKLS